MNSSKYIRKIPLVLGVSILSLLVNACSPSKIKESAVFYKENPELDRVQRHIYLGAGLGTSWLNPDTSEVIGVDVDDQVNAGGQVTFGMDLSRQLSLELHSADLGSAGMSPEGRINYHLNGASALLYVGKQRHKYKRSGLKGYGRLGIGSLHNSAVGNINFEKRNATHVLYGFGLEYMTHLGLGARAEVIYHDEDVRYGQLSLVYRLGKRPKLKQVALVEEIEPIEPVLQAALPEPVVTELIEPPLCGETYRSFAGVNFETDSDQLTKDGVTAISQAVNRLQVCQKAAIKIAGHTDDIGSAKYNLDLSHRRANRVALLFAEMGISETRLEARGFGETKPIYSNNTPNGRRQNRRVELVIE